MISLKEWMEVCNYKITEGSNYLWKCFGDDVYQLDSWSGDNRKGYSVCITFDTKDQTVYQVEVHDYKRKCAYRFINPDFKDALEAEYKSRGLDFTEATDEYEFVDLESEDDWLDKAIAIIAGEDYDTRVSIPLDLPEHELMALFKMAHEADMTFNAYLEKILRDLLADEGFIERMKSNKID
jgi:hypothetical protein